MGWMKHLLACAAVTVLALSGCADGGEPFVAPSSAAPVTADDVPSRETLTRVAAAVNLRPADLRGFEGFDPVVQTSTEQQRIDERFGDCLGLGEPLGRGALTSQAYRDNQTPPFVEWSTAVSRHDRAATTKAVRTFGTAAGVRCWRPVVDQLLEVSAAAQSDTTVSQVSLVPFEVDPGRAEAASGVRATALLTSPQASVGFSLDLVLLSRSGIAVALYGNAFAQVAPEEQRAGLVSRLASRLAAATS